MRQSVGREADVDSAGNVALGKVLRAAMVAGIVAGLMAALFHFLVTQPLIDQAIAVAESRGVVLDPEEIRTASGSNLMIGLLTFAATWALIYGIGFAMLQRLLPVMAPWKRGLYLAALAFWAVEALPFLKCPPLPPGIGDDFTLDQQAAIRLASLLLIMMGSAVAVIFSRLVAVRRGPGAVSLLGGIVVLAIYSALIFVLLPSVPDPGDTPLQVVAPFRFATLGGLALFWLLLGGGFAIQLRGLAASSQERAVAGDPSRPLT
ncbi:MAG: hypothetical protein QOF51_2093 [Chloroflexota bacterium]|nr:hypothetical protein [Chloroflexota bacterium]